MNLDISKFYISAISPDTINLAKKYGFGIESTEFSYAENMDTYYNETIKKIDEYYAVTKNIIFHAPFYEMSMGAIDSKAKKITEERFNQFYEITNKYNPKKLVFHSGFLPNVYYREWFEEKAIIFLKEFIKNKNVEICLENVFGSTPDFIYNIVSSINDDRLKICLDIGHVNVYSDKINNYKNDDLIKYWIDKLYKYINHFHIHNNYGDRDIHADVYDGNINIKNIILYALKKISNPTFTIEVMNIKNFPDFIVGLKDEIL